MESIDHIDLRSLRLFEAVARHQSFAQAAREHGMQRTQASKLIAQLEANLKGKLFRRTTRQVGLTEFGESLLAISGSSLAQLHASLLQARMGNAEIAGMVRFSVSHAYGRQVILPLLQKFQQSNPRIQLDVMLSDSIDDQIVKNLDFSIRMGALPDTSMVARKLANLEVVLVASPKLLAKHRKLKSINDVQSLPMIGFRVTGSGTLLPWIFYHQEQRIAIDTSAAVINVNSIEGVADLVKNQYGIAPVPRFLVEQEIRLGKLKELFPQHRFAPIPVHICFSDRHMIPSRVRLVIEDLLRQVSG